MLPKNVLDDLSTCSFLASLLPTARYPAHRHPAYVAIRIQIRLVSGVWREISCFSPALRFPTRMWLGA